ncbi:MAG TPA: hypothetical protein VG753_03165 [Candidatus Paceibacterota bacterium]|nr:hypothetical protein [Candidatus Paceibacterota bacterium]
MQFIKDNKLYIGIIAVLLLCVWAYFTFFSGGSRASLLTTASPTSPLSPDVLSTLSNLNTIKLDPSIFSDPVFTALSDYSVAIPSEAAGRRNPFSPL